MLLVEFEVVAEGRGYIGVERALKEGKGGGERERRVRSGRRAAEEGLGTEVAVVERGEEEGGGGGGKGESDRLGVMGEMGLGSREGPMI